MNARAKRTGSQWVGGLLVMVACDSEARPPHRDNLAPSSLRLESERPLAAKKIAAGAVRDGGKATVADRESWRGAWLTFVSRRERTIDVDDWMIDRHGHGAFTASRRSRPSGPEASDLALQTSLRSRLAMDDALQLQLIDVKVHDGVAALHGKVASAEQVGEALRVALDTPGVRKVVSLLRWDSRRT
jgi:hypothetical protein